MYEHFRPSDRVFVDREEHLDWMSKALNRCKEKSVVLHLHGIGGIGKSSLLEHWHSTIERSIILDCSRVSEFFSRLDIIAKSAVRLGISLSRFDVLWSIRQRFVQGVEPAKEEGRGWAMDVLAPLPFIGSLTGIGTAIKTISQKISPKLTGKYGGLGSWLQSRLGKNYLEELLEILWKDPRNAEFLYLDALLEDLNHRKDLENPILNVLDGFDEVDDDEPRWNYRGRKISEAELWFVFLSSLSNSVGVVASRKALPKNLDSSLDIEVTELGDLDDASCLELLVKREMIDEDLQRKITEVSGGNPFILDTICDMFSMGGLSAEDVDSFRADTLEEVRLKTWKKLFSQVKDLEPIIERAALIPYFDKGLLEVVVPGLKTYQWEQLTRFSFVRMRDDGSWVLHDLAKELVITELGRQLTSLTQEVSSLLEKESEEKYKLSLRGLAISVEALVSEEDAIVKAKDVINHFLRKDDSKASLEILANIVFRTIIGKAELTGLQGWALDYETRYAEAEAALRESIDVFEKYPEMDFTNHGASLGQYYYLLADVLTYTGRMSEGEEYFLRAIEIQRKLVNENKEEILDHLAESFAHYSFVLANYLGRIDEAYPLAQEAVEIFRKTNNQKQLPWALNILCSSEMNITKRIATYQEAIELQRELVVREPANTRQKAILAAMRNNLPFPLYWAGRIQEAEESLRELIRLRKDLSNLDPTMYGERFASALANYGVYLWETRQLSKAGKFLQESSQMYQKFVQEEPGAFEDKFSRVLFFQAQLLVTNGNVSDAMAMIRRAEDMYRDHLDPKLEVSQSKRNFGLRLIQSSLALHSKILSMEESEEILNEAIGIADGHKHLNILCERSFGEALNNGGVFYLAVDKLSKAKTSLEEATQVLRKTRDTLFLFSENLYALSLGNLAIVYRKDGLLQEANSLYQESLEIFAGMVDKIPNKHQYNNSVILNNYSILLKEMKKLEEAESALTKAIEIQREFSKIEPQYFEPVLAISLNNQGIILSQIDRLSQAEESFKNAIDIRRRLAKQSPEMHNAVLASSLHNYGILMTKIGNQEDAENALREALEIWRQLIEKVPEVFKPKLVRTLHHLRKSLLDIRTKENEVKELEKRISALDCEFSDDDELWIMEEEPLHIW